MYETINEQLKDNFYLHQQIKANIPDFEKKVLTSEMSSFIAAYQLLDIYFKEIKNG